ncbi:MAG: lipopolysaccharide heptosyltransferase II [Ignavibacteriales bacterium]|nr:lipopolysaccharide heptosyltransferase II [Ignavibacteriales bacterium]
MRQLENILIVQTAFPGDLILTLPLAQVLKKHYPSSQIDFVVIPKTAELLANHPAISEVIVYDKRGKDSGFSGLMNKVRFLRVKKYDVAFIPHRSFRSAILVWLSKIPMRIGFDKSKAKWFYSHKIDYKSAIHEIERNLSLLAAVDINQVPKEIPRLYPSFHDKKKVGLILSEIGAQHLNSLIGIAPGSVWATKRWLDERFAELIEKLTKRGFHILLLGSSDDYELCKKIENMVASKHVHNLAGKLSFLQSADMIARCRLLVTNDSAPLHIATSMRVPVVAIFGATAPEYGFGPYDEPYRIVETGGLACRPCGIHGGKKCPTGTFDCMKNITSDHVLKSILSLLENNSTRNN